MPRGPKGEKRPADVIGNHVMRIATGEIDDAPPTPESEGKNAAAVALGRMKLRHYQRLGLLAGCGKRLYMSRPFMVAR
jgi:hypothetical protein